MSSVEEDGGAGELNASQENLGDPIEGEVAPARSFSVGLGWDDWDNCSIVEGGDEGVGVERRHAPAQLLKTMFNRLKVFVQRL
jgi:hypothetical protein